MKSNTGINEADLDNDFEYNFDLNPFKLILDGSHLLVVTSVNAVKHLVKRASARLRAIQTQQNYRRTFKGPVCMIK